MPAADADLTITKLVTVHPEKLTPHPEGPLLIVGAEALAAHAEGFGMDATVVADPGAALAGASLVVTATTSRQPVLPDQVTEGTFVAAVGSRQPEAAEVPPGLISNAAVVVDTMEGAEGEAGDKIHSERAGAFRWADATGLEEVLR